MPAVLMHLFKELGIAIVAEKKNQMAAEVGWPLLWAVLTGWSQLSIMFDRELEMREAIYAQS